MIDINDYRTRGKSYNIPSEVFDREIITKNTRIGYLQDSINIEIPANLGEGIFGVKYFGAYSYFGDGFDARFVEKIGRFSIIGENVTISSHTHDITALSAHPMFAWPKSRFYSFHESFDEKVCELNRISANRISKNLPGIKNKVIIGNDVWIGNGATILNGVRIGDGAVIGACAVVTHDVEPYTIVAGNPAKIIRKRFSDKQIEELLDIQWWDYGPEILNGVYLGDIDKAISEIKAKIANGFKTKKYLYYSIDTVNGIMTKKTR